VKKIIFICISLVLLFVIGSLLFYYLRGEEIKPPKDVEKKAMASQIKERGETIFKRKYYKSRIVAHKKVLSLAPNSVDAKRKLAEAYFQLGLLEYDDGDLTEAKKQVSLALKYDPDKLVAQELLKKIKTPSE
jgi:tetratricopeptide (TPR) repeat protein